MREQPPDDHLIYLPEGHKYTDLAQTLLAPSEVGGVHGLHRRDWVGEWAANEDLVLSRPVFPCTFPEVT